MSASPPAPGSKSAAGSRVAAKLQKELPPVALLQQRPHRLPSLRAFRLSASRRNLHRPSFVGLFQFSAQTRIGNIISYFRSAPIRGWSPVEMKEKTIFPASRSGTSDKNCWSGTLSISWYLECLEMFYSILFVSGEISTENNNVRLRGRLATTSS